MINLKEFIFTVDDILTDQECDFIIEEFGKNNVYKESCFESNSSEMRQSNVDITSLVPNTEAFFLAHNATDRLINDVVDDFFDNEPADLYKTSGVDVNEGNKAVKAIVPLLK